MGSPGLLLALAALAGPGTGISARFSNRVAVHRQHVTVDILVDDPSGAVARLDVALRTAPDLPWKHRDAHPRTPRRWSATFTSTTVWGGSAETTPARPRAVQVQARLYGRRGGLILSTGVPVPFEMDVLTPEQAARRAAVLDRPAEGPGAYQRFRGYVGAEGRAGAAARARAYFGMGIHLTRDWEWVLVTLSVGPSFSPPAGSRGGGPVTLGFRTAVRRYVRIPRGIWQPFLAPFASADLRFPGLDTTGGLIAGGARAIGRDVHLEAAVFGAVAWFSAVAPEDRRDERTLGFTGGVRLGFRLGAGKTPAPPGAIR